MSRLGLEVVEGDGADNWWVDRFFCVTRQLYNIHVTGRVICLNVSVRTQPDHVLGTCTLHWSPHQVHDELLLGEEHLLPAVEQADTEIRPRISTDGALLPVDTFHSAWPGIRDSLYTSTLVDVH